MNGKFDLYKLMQHERKQPLGLYILDGHTPVMVDSFAAWAAQYNHGRRVREDTIDAAHWFLRLFGFHDKYWVSTVFLGIDHSSVDKECLVFETMVKVVGGKWLDYQTRCATWEQAEEMHEKAIEWMK